MKSIITHPIKKILVLRPDRLGDVILTLPVVRNLKEAFPEATITYLCTDYTSPILKTYSLISDLIIFNNKNEYEGFKNIVSLAKELRGYHLKIAKVLNCFTKATLSYSINTVSFW